MTPSRAASSRSRPRRIARAATAVALLVAGSIAAPSDAAPDFRALLEEASVAADKGDFVRAGGLCGEAVALVQSKDDLDAEGECADAVEHLMLRVRTPPDQLKVPRTADAGPTGDVLAALLAKLDANRRGAFVSAPVLAREILFQATETGKATHVAAAAKVLASDRSKSGAGAAAAVVASYAAAFADVTSGAYEKAAKTLDDVAAKALKAHWMDLAAHASAEASAAWVAAKKPDAARASLAAIAAAFTMEPLSAMSARRWATYAKRRLESAPPVVTEPLASFLKGGMASASPPPGGRGGKNGGSLSELGRILEKAPGSKRVVSARCVKDGWEIVWATHPNATASAKHSSLIELTRTDGAVVALYDRSVALAMIDFAGGRGQPGGGVEPCPASAFYLLAEGETWSVTKAGNVTISGGK